MRCNRCRGCPVPIERPGAELVLHLGGHATDGGLIAGWLERNAEALAAQGADGPATPGREAALLQSLGLGEGRGRLAVSAPGLLGPAAQVIAPEGFYIKDVARRIYGLRVLFPRSRLHFMLAVRGADGFLPALLAQLPEGAADDLLPHLDEDILPWSLLVATLRRQAPASGLSVWRHEIGRASW